MGMNAHESLDTDSEKNLNDVRPLARAVGFISTWDGDDLIISRDGQNAPHTPSIHISSHIHRGIVYTVTMRRTSAVQRSLGLQALVVSKLRPAPLGASEGDMSR